MWNIKQSNFSGALRKARKHEALSKEELLLLLDAQGEQCGSLYETARALREEAFGNKVFAYGFVYFSTYCRNNCTFCFYRSDNQESPRYRKPPGEVLRIAKDLQTSGVHLVDLTMGEDPQYVSTEEGRAELLRLAAAIRAQTGLPVMLSPGALPYDTIRDAGAQGVEWYACYQETHNLALFEKLRSGQSYTRRMEGKRVAQASGMLVEEGILAGVGETLEDIADSIRHMAEMGASQVRVMSFVPQMGAPLRAVAGGDLYTRELNTIAVMRIVMRDRLIPASLDVAGKAGLRERLDAGANVVTSIIAPHSGLAGVSNATLDVDNGCRSLPGIQGALEQCGLQLASPGEFMQSLERLRKEYAGHAGSDCWRTASGS